jgi:YebC/PmpR family DNA-binding regulatory protein
MSGHSKWATIKRQKGVNDAKRGAVFTKLGNQIAVAARGGTDPAINSSLAMIIEKAKAANMPMSNIQRAIDRIADKSTAAVEEVVYEGYGPGGIGLIIETATDNRNRTFPEVRTALTKNGGSVAEPGSVMFQFSRKGIIRVDASGEEALLTVLDAGAEDAVEEDGELVVYAEAKDLMKVRGAIVEAGLEVKEAELAYVPNANVEITDAETARKVLKLMDVLDDLDDVTNVHSNFDIDDSIDL